MQAHTLPAARLWTRLTSLFSGGKAGHGPAGAARRSLAGHLMDAADARSGLNPFQARELRVAAQAWLSVVR